MKYLGSRFSVELRDRWTLGLKCGSSCRPPRVHVQRALTTGWQVGTEVDRKPVASAQAGIVGQCGAQAGLPAAAGIPAALLKVRHRAQVGRAGREGLPSEHAAGLHRVGG